LYRLHTACQPLIAVRSAGRWQRGA